MTVALFPHVLMCLTVLEEESVSIMTCASARKSGLGRTVPSTLVDLLTTAQVTKDNLHLAFESSGVWITFSRPVFGD